MKISIIGSNGMLSKALTKYYVKNESNQVIVYGLDAPKDYDYSEFIQVNLLKGSLNYDELLTSDVIFYASGAA